MLLGFPIIGLSQKTMTSTIDVHRERLLETVKVLSHDSLEGRKFGTEGNYKAAHFMAKQFEKLGIPKAFESVYIQSFPRTFKGKERQRLYPIPNPKEDLSNIPDTTIVGGNVVVMIPGKIDKVIAITAHIDHLGVYQGQIYNGADDDASGTAALLAIAEHFKKYPPQHTMIIAAVDAEEMGSMGCSYLLDHFPTALSKVVLNVNMDMICLLYTSDAADEGVEV